MASSCSVDSHRSASRPSPLDKLVIAPLNTPVHGLHKNRPPHSPSPTKAQARTSRASTPCRYSCSGASAVTFNGLTKRYSVLAYGGALLSLAVGWSSIVKLIGTRCYAVADHVRGAQVSRSGSNSHAQQRKMPPRSPAQPSHSGTKIVPHITRPGTSCFRPATSEVLPVKVSQPSGQCSLVGTRAHTPVRCEEDSIRAVWTPGELSDSDPTVCPAKRIASCPAQISVPCATDESDEQTRAAPVCRTAPVQTFAAANRSKVGPRSSCGRASPGLRLDTVGTPKGHEPAAGTIAANRARSAGGGHQTPQLFSHPVIFEDCHTPQSCSQTADTPSEGVILDR